MFRIENNVPDVYPEESRDFQLLSRLGDLVFHQVKTSTDSLKNVSNTLLCDNSLLSLLSTKVGMFTDLDNIEETAHRKALSAFPYIIRYKGSMRGIRYVCNLFEQLANTNVECSYDAANQNVNIVFLKYVSSIELLKVLIEYVRPAGTLVSYVIATEASNDPSDYMLSTTLSYTRIDSSSGNVVRGLGDITDGYTGTIGFTRILSDASDEQQTQESDQT